MATGLLRVPRGDKKERKGEGRSVSRNREHSPTVHDRLPGPHSAGRSHRSLTVWASMQAGFGLEGRY